MSRTRHPSTPMPALGSLLLVLALAFASVAPALAQSGTPEATPITGTEAESTLAPTPCTTRYLLPAGFTDGENVDCSYLSVPAFPGEAGSPVLRLHVMRVHATTATPAEEPLILLTGGPGQAAGPLLALFAPPTEEQPISYAGLLERQDVILLDQRGTGASEPALTCATDVIPTLLPPPSPDGATPAAATPAATPGPAATPVTIAAPTDDQITQGLVSCLQSYRAAGIDLTAFTTENDATDVSALITALGVPRADLYGISFGSFLGERVISRYPDQIRSAALTSIVAPDTDILVRQSTGFDETLTEIFDLCTADPDCIAANPDLEAALTAGYERLATTPAVVDVTDPASGQVFGVEIDGATYLSMLYLLVFTSNSYGVPTTITSVADGDDSILESLAPLLLSGTGTSSGLLTTTYCLDFASGVDLEAVLTGAGVRQTLIDGFSSNFTTTNDACAALGLPMSPADQDAVESDVPTLLVSGGLDPITPSEDADVVLADLPNGQAVTIEAVGHDPVTSAGPCGVAILSSFLADPDTGVDASCASGLTLDVSPDLGGGGTPEATPAA